MRYFCEANISTQQKTSQTRTWLSQADENSRRAKNYQSKTTPGTKSLDACVRLGFPKTSRLLKRKDFERLSKSRSKKLGHWLILLSCPAKYSFRLGITVTKKFGKAHERNRFKRLVKEAFRLMYPLLNDPCDYVVLPQLIKSAEIKSLKLQDIYLDLKSLIFNKK